MSDEQQPERPPGIDCLYCGYRIDCEMATSYIQAEMPVQCPACYFAEPVLTELAKSICSSASNK